MSDSEVRVARAKELKKKRNLAAQSLFSPKNKFKEKAVDPRKPIYKREKMSIRDLPSEEE